MKFTVGSDIFAKAADGTGKERLLFDREYVPWPLSWSPDGRFLAVTENQLDAAGHPSYDLSPDGKRFLMLRRDVPAVTELRVILNWSEELKRLVPTSQ